MAAGSILWRSWGAEFMRGASTLSSKVRRARSAARSRRLAVVAMIPFILHPMRYGHVVAVRPGNSFPAPGKTPLIVAGLHPQERRVTGAKCLIMTSLERRWVTLSRGRAASLLPQEEEPMVGRKKAQEAQKPQDS
jgi:hypothetical protein